MARSRRVMGVDEAGRGAVIGPLVVAGVVVEEDYIPVLKQVGVKDSKKLARERRRKIYERLEELGVEMVYGLVEPSRIDMYTRRSGGPGINALEVEEIALMAKNISPNLLIVDSPTVRTDYVREELQRQLPGVEIISECRADERYPIVAAASIVAKIKRDEAVEEISRELGYVGSGYPSDAKTREFLTRLIRMRENMGIVRKSWRTLDKMVLRITDFLSDDEANLY